MPIFCSTIEEATKMTKLHVRNALCKATKSYRLHSVCKICGNMEEIQAAHFHDNEFESIIADCLESTFRHRNGYKFILENVVDKCITNHFPLYKNVIFLCKSCHVKYDAFDPDTLEKVKRYQQNIFSDKVKVQIGGSVIYTRRDCGCSKPFIYRTLKSVKNEISYQDFLRLYDQQFCKNVFAMNLPALTEDSSLVFDTKGHRRYYADPIFEKTYVCQEWKTKNFKLFENYLKELVIKYQTN